MKSISYQVVTTFGILEKKGLPHAHILLIVHPEDFPRYADDYDRFVRAEISDQDTESRLYKFTIKHNMHGLCGQLNPQSPRMEDENCSKKFPKEFIERTEHSKDGYPMYKRFNNGRCFLTRRILFG